MENIIDQSTVENNLTILEMMAEITRLKQENQMLKCNNELLHNMIINKECVEVTNASIADLELTENFLNNNEIEDLGYDPEEYANAYAEAEKDYKFV